MSDGHGIHVEDPAFSTNTDYSHVDGEVLDRTNDNINNKQTSTNYGDTRPPTEGSSSNCVTHNQFDGNSTYGEADSVFNQQLILDKELKSPADIRHKTAYFPRGGENAGKALTPRYLRTVDDDSNIIIKFPPGSKVPQNPDDYFLEAALITVPRNNQHYMHGNKFQLDHKNNVSDENPYLIRVTPEHFEKGEIAIKLVPVKRLKEELKGITSLPVFDAQTSSGWTADCKTVEELEHTYELSHAQVAFSLGHKNANNEFIRFPNTTVISNEIVEIKSTSSGDVICPNCAHTFNVREQKKNDRKRSASSSISTDKKRPAQRKKPST